MPKEIQITILDNGEIEIEGKNLNSGEQIKEVAKFITDAIANMSDFGHKHSHVNVEQNTESQR